MKYKKVLVLIIIVFVLVAVAVNCFGPSIRLRLALSDYSNIVSDGIPEDLSLTIYYVSPYILTRHPWRIEDLVKATDVKKITIDSEELAPYLELLRKLDASALQPVNEETYLNARLYYVFETDDGKLLEVAINGWSGNAFVNGVEIEPSSVLYDIIIPFLSEEDRNVLGI